MSSRVLHVDIHGQRYAIRSDLDPQYVGEIAAYLDEKMRAAARELANADAQRLAIVAALNITEEFFRARDASEGAAGTLRARALEIERLLDTVLDEAKARVVNE